MPTLDDLRDTRITKLKDLKKLGVDPYPSHVIRDRTIDEALSKEGEDVSVVGRVIAKRGHGKISFMDIVDESGHMQVVCKEDKVSPKAFTLIDLIDLGDFISVQGSVGKTQAGEVSVFAADFQLITKTIRPLPEKWHGLKDVEERYRKRYLDTILNVDVKHRLVLRSKIIDSIRDFLTNRGFLEVETPTLQPIYGGGFARPFVTHHNELDADFYLRISDEMYLKRLIVGGFEKVFEITKVFRNEGIDHDHNPEFTMFEAQIAYKDYVYGMDIIEEIIEYIALRTLGKTSFVYQGQEMNVKRPWPRYRMTEAIQKFTGIDPSSWKSIGEAKVAIQGMDISEKELEGIKHVRTVGEFIAFAFEAAVEKQLIQPTIIYDYPIEVSPLAKKCEDPRFTQRFEMFAFGSELGNNYSELNDPLDLTKRFVEEKKREEAGFEEAHQTDYDYLEAIEHGFPPTCGIAIGVDRLVMLLTDAKSIKEVIPFPTLRPKTDEKPVQTGKQAVPQKVNVGKYSAQKATDDGIGISYEKAGKMLDEYIKDPVTKMHCIESEAIMRSLARYFHEDETVWGTIGLLHDIDWELTKTNTKLHCITCVDILRKNGGTDFLINTIQSHGYGQGFGDDYYGPPELKGKVRETTIEHALAAAETVTGLIIATTLVQPDKKLNSVKPESLLKKYKAKAFAANCRREIIAECEQIGLSVDQFLKIGLKALQDIHGQLGL